MALFEYMTPTESKNMKCSYSPVDTQDTVLQTIAGWELVMVEMTLHANTIK